MQGGAQAVKQILGATGNKNKLAELQVVAERFGLEILSPQALVEAGTPGPPPEVDETGTTYQDNARLKAQAYAQWGNCVALGDDSGLEVEALGNAPGLYSARYLRPDASYPERMAHIVDELRKREVQSGERNRRAHYHCSLVLTYPNGAELTSHASLAGDILDEPRGDGGFGYDPIVLMDVFGKTFAEIDFEVTCREGFRARAAEDLFRQIAELG